jgi:nucleoside phosphorylase
MPDRPANPAIPTIVVPLAFEEGWLRRLIPGLATRGQVVRCGLGRAGVRQTLPGLKPAGPVILCGIAGGLVDAAPVGAAAWVSEAVTEGATLRPDIVPAGVRLERLYASETLIETPRDKALLAARTGTTMVDMETASFAEIARERGWAWGVLRGVSDGPEHDFPPEIAGWITPKGDLRRSRVTIDLVRKPRLLRAARELSRNGGVAMRAVAELLSGWLGDRERSR